VKKITAAGERPARKNVSLAATANLPFPAAKTLIYFNASCG